VSGSTTASTSTEVFTVPANTRSCGVDKINLLQLEEYKKVFQSFWVQFIEQFIPATTIFVSGEKWCNSNELVCPELEECDFDYEFVEADVTFIEIETDGSDIGIPPDISVTVPVDSGELVESTPDNEGEQDSSNDEPISIPGFDVIPTPQEPGVNTQTPISIPNTQNLVTQKSNYQGRLTEPTTETVIL
jgi:hypothetical protein